MIREVRRYQQEEKDAGGLPEENEDDEEAARAPGPVPGATAHAAAPAEDDEDDPSAKPSCLQATACGPERLEDPAVQQPRPQSLAVTDHPVPTHLT